jgi:C-terminal processing protease CtpA/Prc
MAPMQNSEGVQRHYAIKRTDSYDGLGIIISADAQTHANPRIRDVEIASPGYRVGLRKNDRIIAVNGINVENVDFSDVLVLIKQGLDDNNLLLSVIKESILM